MTLTLRPTLNHADMERFHERSLDLLERVGIDYGTPRALEILEQAGCRVDYGSNRAWLPPRLVEWALEQAPQVVRLCARDPAQDIVLDGHRPHHTTDSQGTQAIGLETGERHTSTGEDLRRGLLFADALDQIEIVNVMVAATEVPPHLRTVQHFALAFGHTAKHVRCGVLHAEEVPFLVDLACAAVDGEFQPIFSATDCTISPLMHDGPMTEACIELARIGVPIILYPMPLAGGTAPVTPAGTALLHNVEFLSGLVLFQVARPGSPVIYGTGASQLDMQTGRFGGSPDGHALRLALLDLARFYHLPANLWGLSTASNSLDALYGHEATVQALLAYLAGADEIYSAGLLGASQVLSLEKMVLDNHLARQIALIARSIPVDEEHMQADLIERVGSGGHYLGQQETRSFTRHEYMPVWPPAGSTVLEMAHEEALDILRTHEPPELPRGASEDMDRILAEADRALSRRRS